jgi:hypothetical protein
MSAGFGDEEALSMLRRNPFRKSRSGSTRRTAVARSTDCDALPAVSQNLLRRRGEETGTYFRCSRYFAVGHEWFAATREYGQLGPFPGRAEAELGLAWHLTVREDSTDEAPCGGPDRGPPTSLEILISEFRICRREAERSSALSAYASARQRLDEMEDAATDAAHTSLQVRAIRHFLTELEV